MADGTRKLNVFISYSRDDLAFADQLDAALGVANFATTLDRHGISAGEDWKTRLGALIRDADTVVFVLSPSSARSSICAWEVEEAVRLGKRILPVLCRPLEGVNPPPQLEALNYIFFYAEPRFPGSGFGIGLVGLVSALNTDLDWLREHTRYLQRATEWDAGGRPANRLLSGPDIKIAKDWAARRPKGAPAATPLQLDFIKASEAEENRQQSAEVQRLKEIAEAQAERGNALAEREEAQKREAEAQKREVEAQRREAEQAKRVAQRTLAGAAVAVVLALAAGGSALYAYKQRETALQASKTALTERDNAVKATKEANAQRDRANEQHGLAVARQLATEARVKLEQGGESATELERSLLLATASLKFAWTEEGFEAWSKAIEFLPPKPSVLGQEGPYAAMTFSPDGARLAVAGKESIVVMDSASLPRGTPPKIVAKLPQAGVAALAFKPPDGEIVVAGVGSSASVWSLSGPRQIKELPGHSPFRFDSVAFDSQGRRLAAAGYYYHARMFETEGWTETGWVGNEPVMVAAFSPDDRWLLTTGHRVVAWDLKSAMREPAGNPRAPVDPDSMVVVDENHFGTSHFLLFGGQGHWLVESNGLQSVVPAEAGQKFSVAERLRFSSNPIVAVRSDAGFAATKTGDGEVAVWRMDLKGKKFQELSRIPASPVAFVPTGDWLIGAADNRLELWDLAAGAEWRRLPHEAGVLGLALSRSGRLLATTTADGFARVWETNTWREIFKAEIHRTEGGAAESYIAFSANDRWLAATSQKVVKVFSTDDWKEVATSELEDSIHSVAFGSDSKWLVVSADPQLALMAADSWATARFQAQGADTLSISPDGRQLAISKKPYCTRALQVAGFARLWEISSGQQKAEFPITDGSLNCVPAQEENQSGKPDLPPQDMSWREWTPIVLRVNSQDELSSPDGAWIAKKQFMSDSIELYPSAAAGRPGIKHRAGGVAGWAFSRDGKWLATAGSDGAVRIWTLDRDTMIAQACARLGHDLSRDFWRQKLGDEPYSPVCPGLPVR